jgi:hypothetical protein
MNNTVNFSSLRRNEIRKTIGEGEGQIIIYNPSPEKKVQIEAIIRGNFKKGSTEINISAEDILIDLLSLTTNIILDFDRDNEEDMKMVKEIIEDPHPTFEDAIIEVRNLITEIGGRYIDTLNTLSKLPKEELLKLFPQQEEIAETEEEKELRELKEKTKALEDKINNKVSE